MSSVLIVSNASAELRHVVTSLVHGGYDAQGPLEPLDALRWCSTHPPAALLVDLELRDLSAAEFCVVVRGRIASARLPISASRTIDTHNRRLRVKLRGAGRQIQTVPRLGYRFSED